MINKFSFTIFHWQGFLVHVDDQQVSLDKFRLLKINNFLATFSLLSVYTSKFQTWQFFLVKEKLARQIFLDKENLSTIPHLHEQFFLVKANLSRKNCSCKWGLTQEINRDGGSIWWAPDKLRKIKRELKFAYYFYGGQRKAENRNLRQDKGFYSSDSQKKESDLPGREICATLFNFINFIQVSYWKIYDS